MKSFFKKNYAILILMAIGLLLRIINLSWGSPFFFHPDERNIASSVSQLLFPTQMNPHFFSYGSMPIYVIFFLGLLWQGLPTNHVSFDQAILMSRMISALFSLLLIPSVFYIGSKIKDITTGILAATFTTFSIGFIQFAHFGTFEMWLTLFTLWFFYFCLRLLQHSFKKDALFSGIFFGLLIATKVSSLILFFIPFIILFLPIFIKSSKLKQIKHACISFVLFTGITLLIFFISNPFSIFASADFFGAIHYESGVALGTISVFYSSEFIQTIPILFQFLHVYPFLLNPLITLLFPMCLLFTCIIAWKKNYGALILLIVFFLTTFLSQAFLFVKWTRYLIPTIPFIYLLLSLFFSYMLFHKNRLINLVTQLILFFSIIVSCILTSAYALTVYASQDSRVYAANLALTTIPHDAQILSEVYDLGIISFNPYFSNISLFNFYDLTSNSLPELAADLKTADYIILPSQRILKIRLQKKAIYPQGYAFYKKLIDGSLGYNKIYETPCDLFCKLVYLNNPTFSFEETATVFDRPEVFIFKKEKLYTQQEYQQALQ